MPELLSADDSGLCVGKDGYATTVEICLHVPEPAPTARVPAGRRQRTA